jgi:MFS family permease
MNPFLSLLRRNHNYRNTWIGQVVSEVGDHFNNVAVFDLVLHQTHSGMAVTLVMLARAIPAILAGPLAGITLDRFDRRRMMIASDLVRAVVAIGFIFAVDGNRTWLVYLLTALLMLASPFFTSGRAAILPSIATKEELHTANSLTQTTQWSTLCLGAFLGGIAVSHFDHKEAFVINAVSFLVSALCISRLRLPGRGFLPARAVTESDVVRPWHEYMEGLRYMRERPLILGIGMIAVGWATGGGAAQILFSLFGEEVFHRGATGIGSIWGCAGIGLLIGGAIAHRIGPRLNFDGYKRAIVVCYILHGGAYILFAKSQSFAWALVFIGLSRLAVGVTSVLNMGQLLRHVADEFRGRVFSTIETMTWSVMMVSMLGAGVASQQHFDTRAIGVASGALSSSTAIFWAWAHLTGRLPEPAREGVDPKEIEVHGEPTV